MRDPGMIIPLAERSSALRDFLFKQTDSIVQVRKRNPRLIPEESGPFLFLCAPWILLAANKDQEALLNLRRKEFEAAGFQGSSAKAGLETVLVQDKHLRECCANTGQLAQFLDERFIGPMVNRRIEGAADETLPDRFEEFSRLTYEQGRFKTIGLYHIFNFVADNQSLWVDNIRIERLDGPTVSRILGEPSF